MTTSQSSEAQKIVKLVKIGIKVGNIFKLPADRLPFQYKVMDEGYYGNGTQGQPRVGFIVFGINHNVSKNGGWVTVSNQGLELSQGEFVIFANCDDDCDHSLIERLVDSMRNNPSVAISFSRSLMIDENDNIDIKTGCTYVTEREQ